MELDLPILYLIFFVIFFLLGLYAEYKTIYETNEDIHKQINHLIIILMFFSLIFMVFAGLTLYQVTIDYVDGSGDLQSSFVFSYQPFAYACFILSFIPGIILFTKVMDTLNSNINQ